MVETAQGVPPDHFKSLEFALKQAKASLDELEFRLDEIGVACGGASQALSFKQRIETVVHKLIGAMDAVQDFKDIHLRRAPKAPPKSLAYFPEHQKLGATTGDFKNRESARTLPVESATNRGYKAKRKLSFKRPDSLKQKGRR